MGLISNFLLISSPTQTWQELALPQPGELSLPAEEEEKCAGWSLGLLLPALTQLLLQLKSTPGKLWMFPKHIYFVAVLKGYELCCQF